MVWVWWCGFECGCRSGAGKGWIHGQGKEGYPRQLERAAVSSSLRKAVYSTQRSKPVALTRCAQWPRCRRARPSWPPWPAPAAGRRRGLRAPLAAGRRGRQRLWAAWGLGTRGHQHMAASREWQLQGAAGGAVGACIGQGGLLVGRALGVLQAAGVVVASLRSQPAKAKWAEKGELRQNLLHHPTAPVHGIARMAEHGLWTRPFPSTAAGTHTAVTSFGIPAHRGPHNCPCPTCSPRAVGEGGQEVCSRGAIAIAGSGKCLQLHDHTSRLRLTERCPPRVQAWAKSLGGLGVLISRSDRFLELPNAG